MANANILPSIKEVSKSPSLNKIFGPAIALGLLASAYISIHTSGYTAVYKEGRVVYETPDDTTNRRLVESSGALFGNESVKLGKKEPFVLQIETSDGFYTVSVHEGEKPFEAFKKAVEFDDKVKFLIEERFGRFFPKQVYKRFGEDLVGKLSTDEIEILK